jgi:hypothetical protein
LNQLSIDRFSPYFDRPASYGIENVRPMTSYYDIFPPRADLAKLAYHFHGDFDSDALNDPEVLSNLERLVSDWIASWEDGEAPPVLSINQITSDSFLVTDTRAIATLRFRFVSRSAAKAALFGTHHERASEHEWCLENRLCVLIDDVVVPLATASSDLYRELAEIGQDDFQTQLGSGVLEEA